MSKWSSSFRDSRWQKLRLEIMERDGWTCMCCGKKDGKTLNVHHAYYEAGKAPWEYPEDTLTTLCEDCHLKIHEDQKKLLACIMSIISIGEATSTIFETLEGFLDGYYKGPSFENSEDYNAGYSRGRVTISTFDASAISKANNIDETGANK